MTLMIVGDAWSKDDEDNGRPFSGTAGSLLRAKLSQVGIDIRAAYLTTVFPRYMGEFKNFCGPKSDGIPGMPAIITGKYLPKRFAPDLDRLAKEIRDVHPVCILALGSIATWALLHERSLKKIRGAPLLCAIPGCADIKVFPTYHPIAIFKDWTLNPIFLADLHKLRGELDYPEIRRPHRQIWIEPAISDLYRFEQEHILPSPQLSIDIETSGTSITCIGFAPTPQVGLVVPFVAHEGGPLYWKTMEEEIEALRWVKRMCGLDKVIVGQNILYDIHHLWRNYGIQVPHMGHDTMLLHHALQPEMEKGLGFLGSVYTNEAAWKFMGRTKVDTIKRED